MSNEELFEYDTFVLEMDGKDVEFAITEEFEFEGKTYIICGEVTEDEINDEELYLFEGVTEGDEITVKSIETEEEYDRVVEAYCEIAEEE